MYKIIFMGTPVFSVPILEALVNDSEYDVIGVITQPDRRVGRKKIMTPSPVKQKSLELGIPVFQPEKLSGSEEMKSVIELNPDLIITAAYGQYVPTKLLNAPKYRAINVHASLLPKYRGAAPIHYALINGDEKTGVSIMYMEKEMDAGDILSSRSIIIDESDNVGSLFEKLSILGRNLLMDTLPDFFEGNINPVKQKEAEVTYAPMISREDEQINWSLTATQIVNKIRGMNPFPGAYTFLNNERFKIWMAKATVSNKSAKAGTIVKLTKEEIWVKCQGDTAVVLMEVQPFGKPKMPVETYLAGALNYLEEGVQFEEK